MSRIFVFQLMTYSLMGAILVGTAQSSDAQISDSNPEWLRDRSVCPTGCSRAPQLSPIKKSDITFIPPKAPFGEAGNRITSSLESEAFVLNTSGAIASVEQLPSFSASDLLDPDVGGSQPLQTAPQIVSQEGGVAPTLTPDLAPGKQPFQPQRVPLRPSPRRQDRQRMIGSPGITSVTPSAYGKSWGSAGIGAGFQSRTRFTETSDGAIAAGVGFGDARKAVGLDVGVAIFNLSDSFGDRGGISFKLHRLLPDDFAVAVGWQNAIVWGSTDAGNSIYGVVTKMFRLQETTEKPFSRLYLSAGIGNGQFRSEFDINDENETVNVFGSAALRVAEPVNAIAEWTGQDLTLAVSYIPFRNLPLVITPALTDVTGNAGDGARFILGIGYGFSFK